MAATLSRVGHDVTVIEPDPKRLEELRVSLDARLMEGSGANMDHLAAAGAEGADFYFGLSDDDETNMLGSVMAKTRGCRTVARINSGKYIDTPVSRKLAEIGIDIAVSPKLVVAEKIAQVLLIPALVGRTSLAKGKMMLAEAKVRAGAPMCRNALLNTNLPRGIMVGAIFRGAHVIIPSGKTIIRENDHLVVALDSPKRLDELECFSGKAVGGSRRGPERVLIVGARHSSVQLARKLESKGVGVTLIDGSRAKCLKAAERLNRTTVVNGDPTDKKLLLEEGLERMDAVISMTPSEEFNILVALLARMYRIPKVVAVLHRTALKPMVETVGIDFAASVKHLAVEAVLKEVEQLDILRTVTLHGGELMVFETRVTKRSSATGKKIMNLKLPKGVLIVGIFRGGKTLIPGGDEVIMKGDRVIVFCFQEMMERMDRMFRGKGLIL